MITAGIVCEYNPFHNGHALQIQEIRSRLGKDTAVLCVMSGSFVQRGEPAAFNKFARASAAVSCGADLVLELPTDFSLSSAERFAAGAVDLLMASGVCDYISFGTETEDIRVLSRMAEVLCSGRADEEIRSCLKKGISYAEARQQALMSFCGEGASCLSTANNILAVEYLKAMKRLGAPFQALPVLRTGTAHDTPGCSGSSIRQRLITGESWQEDVPVNAGMILAEELSAGRGPVMMDNYEQAILYRLRSMSRYEFAGLPDATEGLGDRLWKTVRNAATLDRLLLQAKTKRYALSRLRRMVMCAWLGITRENRLSQPLYLRVLAAGEHGRQLLAEMKKRATLPVLVRADGVRKLGENVSAAFERECRMTDLYSLGYPNSNLRLCGLDRSSCPVHF